MHTFKCMVYAPMRMLSRLGLVSHQKEDGRLYYNAWVKRVFSHIVPGYLDAQKGTNSLDPEAPCLYARLGLFTFWILPCYMLEQMGLVLLAAVLGSLVLARGLKGKKGCRRLKTKGWRICGKFAVVLSKGQENGGCLRER